MAPPKTPNAARGTIHGTSHLDLVKFTIRALPMPAEIVAFLRANVSILKRLQFERAAADNAEDVEEDNESEQAAMSGDVVHAPTVRPDEYWDALSALCLKVGGEWADVVDSIWAFGPHGAGECLLIDGRMDGAPNS